MLTDFINGVSANEQELQQIASDLLLGRAALVTEVHFWDGNRTVEEWYTASQDNGEELAFQLFLIVNNPNARYLEVQVIWPKSGWRYTLGTADLSTNRPVIDRYVDLLLRQPRGEGLWQS